MAHETSQPEVRQERHPRVPAQPLREVHRGPRRPDRPRAGLERRQRAAAEVGPQRADARGRVATDLADRTAHRRHAEAPGRHAPQGRRPGRDDRSVAAAAGEDRPCSRDGGVRSAARAGARQAGQARGAADRRPPGPRRRRGAPRHDRPRHAGPAAGPRPGGRWSGPGWPARTPGPPAEAGRSRRRAAARAAPGRVQSGDGRAARQGGALRARHRPRARGQAAGRVSAGVRLGGVPRPAARSAALEPIPCRTVGHRPRRYVGQVGAARGQERGPVRPGRGHGDGAAEPGSRGDAAGDGARPVLARKHRHRHRLRGPAAAADRRPVGTGGGASLVPRPAQEAARGGRAGAAG